MRALISILFALSVLRPPGALAQDPKTPRASVEEPCGCDNLAHMSIVFRRGLKASMAIRIARSGQRFSAELERFSQSVLFLACAIRRSNPY
jgi:hypothetical protein